MDLEQFMTYCTLKGLIQSNEDIKLRSEYNVDSCHKVAIQNENYKASLVYSVTGGQIKIISGLLYKTGPNKSVDTFHQPGVGDLVRAFCNGAE